MNKILAFGVTFLFVMISIILTTAQDIEKISLTTSKNNWLYVGGSGSGNYSKINDAYDDANYGDTIFVYSGTYYEYLLLDKTVNLIGEDKDTTLIIYNSKTTAPIKIQAPNVVISGFTLYNPNPDLVCYITIYPGSNHTSILNCIFYNSPLHFDDQTVGINIAYSSYNRISNCTFLYNDDEGICLNHRSSHNIVENCVFTGCCDGIEFQNSSFNTIDNCTMNDGTHCGISITDAEPLTSYNNIIKNCKIYNNEVGGIYLNNAYNNVIYNCSLENNVGYGIYVSGRYSCNNLIVNNKISGSTGSYNEGLILGFSCHNNTFSNNIISGNNYGVCIEYNYQQDCCTDNLFYHNNFIYNDLNAYDECSNFWDNGYPSGGNYWDDYTGVDDDGDGIGDTPYNITGGGIKDYYPLMEPWVKDELTVEANGPYYGLINEPMQFYGLAVGGYKPYIWSWDFGDGKTSDEQNPICTYTEAGRYDVVLNVTDSHGNSSIGTTFAWIQETNDPPNKPGITGETNGKVGIEYDYKFETIDPDENPVWYMIEWGDGTSSGWVGPYNSGQKVTLNHSWSRPDTYTIKAKTKDIYGVESEWETLEVTIPKSKPYFFSIIEQLIYRFPLFEKIIKT